MTRKDYLNWSYNKRPIQTIFQVFGVVWRTTNPSQIRMPNRLACVDDELFFRLIASFYVIKYRLVAVDYSPHQQKKRMKVFQVAETTEQFQNSETSFVSFRILSVLQAVQELKCPGSFANSFKVGFLEMFGWLSPIVVTKSFQKLNYQLNWQLLPLDTWTPDFEFIQGHLQCSTFNFQLDFHRLNGFFFA